MWMFTYAPDTSIDIHPIKFGSGNWTAVTGIMTGTFSKQMVLSDETSIQPTGKKFNITMATIAHWNNGKIIEEYLFWDNAAIMKQMGIGQ